MAKRICLLTGYETNCNSGCYNCGCGGEVAFKLVELVGYEDDETRSL